MDNNNNIDNTSLVEVDLLDFRWRLVSQWKVILLFSLVVAAVVLLLGYRRDQSRYKIGLTEKKNQQDYYLNASEKRMISEKYGSGTVDILEELDERDQTAVTNLLELEMKLHDLKEYYSQSPYMHLKTDHIHCLAFDYVINCKEPETEKQLDILYKGYKNFLYKNEIINKIKDEMGLDIDDSFIRELIVFDEEETIVSVDHAGMDSFDFKIYIPESVDNARGIENAVNEGLEAYCAELSKTLVPHSIELIQASDCYIADRDLLVDQIEVANNIAILANNMKVLKDGLKDKQKTAYDMIISGDAETVADTGSKPSLEKLEDAPSPHLRIKYGLVGFLLGIMIYIALSLVLLIIRGIYYSPITLKKRLGVRVIGQIHAEGKNSIYKKLFTSKIADRIRYGSRGNLNDQLTGTISEIAAVGHMKEIPAVTLIECGTVDDAAKDMITSISDSLSQKKIINNRFTQNELKADDYLHMKAVVLAVQNNHTTMKEIKAILEQIRLFEIYEIGMVYFD